MNSKIKTLSFIDGEEKVLYYLKTNNGYVNKSITNIAKDISLSREAVSRIVTRLVNKGIVKKENGTIKLL